MVLTVLRILLFVLPLQVCSQDCFLPRNLTNCEECAAEGLDLSTGCTTCVSPLSIECEEGEQNCAVGNFVFSALFHSYQNPTHMCAECSDLSSVTCASVGRGTNCGLRFIYCLQPYGSPSQSFNPNLVTQARFDSGKDSEVFLGNYFTQSNTNTHTPNKWNRSNPFTRKFGLWPGKTQLAIVVYNTASRSDHRVVDRVLIDLELNISSSFTERRTYSGVNNFSHFDMSFRIDGECGANYYGPQCSIFCRPEEGVFTCDNEGNKVCSNKDLDIQTNCTKPSAYSSDIATLPADTSSTKSIPNWIWGMTSGVMGVAVILLLVIILANWFSRKRKVTAAANTYDVPRPADSSIDIILHTNIGYRANEDVSKSSPQSPCAIEDSYGYISPIQNE